MVYSSFDELRRTLFLAELKSQATSGGCHMIILPIAPFLVNDCMLLEAGNYSSGETNIIRTRRYS